MVHDFWSIISLISLAGWVGAAIGFIFTAFPKRDSFESQPAVKWGCALAVSYALWITGLLNA